MINKEINYEICDKLAENEIYIIDIDGQNYIEVNSNNDEEVYINIINIFNIEIEDFEAFNEINCFAYTDEFSYCECGTAHWNDDLIYGDGVAYCEKCADYSDLLELYINEERQGFNTSILNYNEVTEFLKENRFHRVGEYDFYFGDNTSTIINDLHRKLKNKYSYVWIITHIAQFGASAELYLQLDKNGSIGKYIKKEGVK